MDDIQRVDCFERLHRHLLQHEPELQKRTEALQPYAYRSQDLTFFLTRLVGVLSHLDEETAEGKRRIRQFVQEIGQFEPAESAQKQRLMIREHGGVWGKAPGKKQEAALTESFRNLKALSPDPAETGVAFDKEMARLDYLGARIAFLRKLLPCLSNLNVYHFLARIGFPVLVPDRPAQVFFFRLGLLPKEGATPKIHLESCQIGETIASSLKRPLTEVDLWVRAFVGTLPNLSSTTSLCGRTPLCPRCALQPYCHYFRYQRPRGQDFSEPLPLKQWRPTERPRERLAQNGPSALEDTELLAIILRTGAGKVNVLELARRLLERFGTLRDIEEASLEELQGLHGIGENKAIELKAVFELGRRLIHSPMKPGDAFASSEQVFRGYRTRFSHVKQEEFILLMLDNKNQVIREEVVSRGSLNASIVHPREVFKAVIRASAASVLFIHNHPSGDPTPSHDDEVITRRLQEAAEFLQIRVLDHLIIGDSSYYSFTDGEISRG